MKVVLRQVYSNTLGERNNWNNKPNCTPQGTKKSETQTKLSRKKQTIQIRAKINRRREQYERLTKLKIGSLNPKQNW